MTTMTDWHLVGDIGGTNARFGIAARGDRAYRDIATYEVANFPEFGLVLDQLMRDIAASGLAQGSPAAVCLAVAGPPHVETISFTNSSWRFSRDLLRERTGALPAPSPYSQGQTWSKSAKDTSKRTRRQ
jgi:glucokinase